jgi:hypothetical protein
VIADRREPASVPSNRGSVEIRPVERRVPAPTLLRLGLLVG